MINKALIDLAGHEQVDAYEIPHRIRERQVLIDHVEAAARGGPTADTNLAPLCRHHHRLRTHSRWRYEKIDPTTFVWRSPVGMRIRRDHTGTQIQPQP